MMHSPRHQVRRAPRLRRGVSLPEILITLAVSAILASIAGSPLKRLRDGYAVRATRSEITAALDAARSGAMQRGRTGRFAVRGNAVVAFVDTVTAAGGPVTGTFVVLAPQDFKKAYGVTLTLAAQADTMIAYDGRGFASPRLNRIARVIMTKGTTKDSVCITNMGQILPRGCSL